MLCSGYSCVQGWLFIWLPALVSFVCFELPEADAFVANTKADRDSSSTNGALQPASAPSSINIGRPSSRLYQAIDHDRDQWWNELDGPVRRRVLSCFPSLTMGLTMLPDGASAALEASIDEAKPSKTASSNTIIPFSSVRKYKTITLSNGLRVILVSDRYSVRSSCSLSVLAGQFCDPDDLPGAAHLLEHMILSYNSTSTLRPKQDFEEWLSEREGFSNGFTANQRVCFHFSCPRFYLAEALQRFSGLFVQSDVEAVCRDEETLKREVRRVNSELNFDSLASQEEYLTKAFVNIEHPYSRFSRGSLESLEEIPASRDIDVGSCLIQFFRRYYLPSKAVLVVVSPQDLGSLERWVGPFSTTLSRVKHVSVADSFFPGRFLQGNRYKHMVLYRKMDDEGPDDTSERLTMQWTLDLDYRETTDLITISQVAFVLNQIIARRGPGGLYQFLCRRSWVLQGSQSIPRVTIPVDVSGFQILKLELTLTQAGFLNRANVVSAVYACLDTMINGDSFGVSRELISQYAATAKLFGYTLAPRPPDAIELSFDALLYGIEAVGSGRWYRFPTIDDERDLRTIRRAVGFALETLKDPNSAVIIVSASDSSLNAASKTKDPFPVLSSARWTTERVGGGRFCFIDLLPSAARIEQLVLSVLVETEELLPPVVNPLVSTQIRPVRTSNSEMEGFSATQIDGKVPWTFLNFNPLQQGLSLPRIPPEPSCRCAFFLQLSSPRPARANVRQAARAELWKLTFEKAMSDLAEFGAVGGLAYDISYNSRGLRLSFLGISQTLPSYARRVCRRLMLHQQELLNGSTLVTPTIRRLAILNANNARGLSPGRRKRIVSNLRIATADEIAEEGFTFLRSFTGAICFAEGDLTMAERIELMGDLRDIFKTAGSAAAISKSLPPEPPLVDDLLYKPVWKPRYASPCTIAGVNLMVSIQFRCIHYFDGTTANQASILSFSIG